jgi:hypothetical protein
VLKPDVAGRTILRKKARIRRYNRFNRSSGHGIWQQIFETLPGSPEPPEQVAPNSTHVKSARLRRRRKRGLGTGDGYYEGRPQQQSFMHLSINYAECG